MRVFDAKAETTYLTMRFVFLVLAGLLMVRLLRAYVPTGQALTITILFFLLYNLSALPHIQPAEEINIAIFAAAFRPNAMRCTQKSILRCSSMALSAP